MSRQLFVCVVGVLNWLTGRCRSFGRGGHPAREVLMRTVLSANTAGVCTHRSQGLLQAECVWTASLFGSWGLTPTEISLCAFHAIKQDLDSSDIMLLKRLSADLKNKNKIEKSWCAQEPRISFP